MARATPRRADAPPAHRLTRNQALVLHSTVLQGSCCSDRKRGMKTLMLPEFIQGPQPMKHLVNKYQNLMLPIIFDGNA